MINLVTNAHRHEHSADGNTSNQSLRFAESATHPSLETISAGA